MKALQKTKNGKYLIGLALFASFLITANVRAETIYYYGLSTATMEGWETAAILTSKDSSYVNPSNQFVNGKADGTVNLYSTWNSELGQFDDWKVANGVEVPADALWGHYIYSSTGTTWGQVEQSLIWKDLMWATPAPQGHSGWNSPTGVPWISSSNVGSDIYDGNADMNGFYAYKYSMQLTSDYKELSGALGLNVMADDYLAAIYANGTLIYSYDIEVGAPIDNGWLGDYMELNFNNISLFDEGWLELIFVVHNTDYAAFGVVQNNPTGLLIDGWLRAIEFDIPTDVPEPTTIALVGLGLVGLGLVARRKK